MQAEAHVEVESAVVRAVVNKVPGKERLIRRAVNERVLTLYSFGLKNKPWGIALSQNEYYVASKKQSAALKVLQFLLFIDSRGSFSHPT